MPIRILENGRSNTIKISRQTLDAGNGTISVNGNNNRIEIGSTDFNIHIDLVVGGDCITTIGANINCFDLTVYQASNTRLVMGAFASFNGKVRIQMHEPSSLDIGDGCLMADQVEITTSDMHSILDLETNRRINPARDISIGAKVWIGHRAMILKGSKIGRGSVIGASAIVAGEVPENCVAAGNPARVIRRNIAWDMRIL